MLNYSHMFAEEYGFPFLRAKIEDIAGDVMSSEGLHEISTSTYRLYVRIEKVTLRHSHLLDVLKELN